MLSLFGGIFRLQGDLLIRVFHYYVTKSGNYGVTLQHVGLTGFNIHISNYDF